MRTCPSAQTAVKLATTNNMGLRPQDRDKRMARRFLGVLLRPLDMLDDHEGYTMHLCIRQSPKDDKRE
jgi:hypothetical protein